jgi:hypothetical protein
MMKIQHKQWGEVEGAEVDNHFLMAGKRWILKKEGRMSIFYENAGWSEVPEMRLIEPRLPVSV